MGRHGYIEDLDNWALIMWRGRVASAIRGKRGQAMLREMRDALDAMPDKRLISQELQSDEEVCALGALGRAKGVDLATLDPEDHDGLAKQFNVAPCLIQEVEWINDEWGDGSTPEGRWKVVRRWVEEQIRK